MSQPDVGWWSGEMLINDIWQATNANVLAD